MPVALEREDDRFADPVFVLDDGHRPPRSQACPGLYSTATIPPQSGPAPPAARPSSRHARLLKSVQVAAWRRAVHEPFRRSARAWPAVPPLPPHTGGSAILKIVAIGILGTCLMIPLTLVWILVAERSQRRDEVVTETVSSIGRAQTVGGVVLDLPYEALERQPNGATATVTRHAYVHPEQLTIEATATPEIRHRSLYEVIVYRTTVRLKGTIAPPDLARLNAAPVAVHWDRAATTVEIADLRGTLAVSPLTFGDRRR